MSLSDSRDELLSASADVISSGGGREDFTAFAESRWPHLFRLAYGLTGDRWAAEDVTQATLAKVYVSWRRVRRADDPDAYVRRMLINTSNRRFRGHRVAEEPGDPPEGMTGLSEQGHAEAVADRAALLAALRGLPRRQRAVVVLRFWEDLTDTQIAAALGCSASTVRSQLTRALARLRSITTSITSLARPGGVFASGTVDGRHWQLAVQDIAAPGYRCVPAVTVNGNDAEPVFSGSKFMTPVGNPAFVAAGPWAFGAGFAFIQVPARATWLWLDPSGIGGLQIGMQPVTVTACGQRFRLVGFAYPLTGTVRINETPPGSVASYTAAATQSDPVPPVAGGQVDGLWQNTTSAHDQAGTATLASGPGWVITAASGTAGDCYHLLSGQGSAGSATSTCAPVSTPLGQEAIVALPSPALDTGGPGTGYAAAVSPGTDHLVAGLSDGSTLEAFPVVLDGRKYAAFFVPDPGQVRWLEWVAANGRVTARTTMLPRSGYVRFQP